MNHNNDIQPLMNQATEKENKLEEKQKRFFTSLKSTSNYYPRIIIREMDGILYHSSLIRINREGEWFIVHCVEGWDPQGIVPRHKFSLDYGKSIYALIYLYQLDAYTKKKLRDKDQRSEGQRLSIAYDVTYD